MYASSFPYAQLLQPGFLRLPQCKHSIPYRRFALRNNSRCPCVPLLLPLLLLALTSSFRLFCLDSATTATLHTAADQAAMVAEHAPILTSAAATQVTHAHFFGCRLLLLSPRFALNSCLFVLLSITQALLEFTASNAQRITSRIQPADSTQTPSQLSFRVAWVFHSCRVSCAVFRFRSPWIL